MTYLPLLEYTRAGIVESIHTGAIAVTDAHGRLVASYGDPRAVVYLRSSAKPFQALPNIESGAVKAYGFTPPEIALMCASHMGCDMHADTARAMQQKIGITEADLLCGTHPIEDVATAKQLIRAGLEPTQNRHNCSGKHSGMLAHAKHLGLPLVDYINPSHPIQQTRLNIFAQLCSVKTDEVVVGVDGCSAPNFAVPLQQAAAAFARFAHPSAGPAEHAEALAILFAAMTAHPEMIRGPHGYDTELMRLRPGHIAAKFGAEAYQAIALAPDAIAPGSPALGITFKVADGAARAVPLIASEVLRQLGVLREADLAALGAMGFALPQPVKNWRGVPVGETRAPFILQRH